MKRSEIASFSPNPGAHRIGAGQAAAETAALAANVIRAAARSSEGHWPEAGGVAAQAAALSDRARELAGECADAYAQATDALASRSSIPQGLRDARLGAALDRAADVPLAICSTATDVVDLAAASHDHLVSSVRADACGAAMLAAGAANACARIVAENLAVGDDDARLEKAARQARTASQVAATLEAGGQ